MPARVKHKTLYGTRIYIRKGSYQYLAAKPIPDKTGKLKRWHILCPIADGEAKARDARERLLNITTPREGGNFPIHFQIWKEKMLAERRVNAPTDPMRRQIWEESTKAILSQYGIIERGFCAYDVGEDDLLPADVARFLEHWKGRRSAKTYRSILQHFCKWLITQNLRRTNPASADIIELKYKPSVKAPWTDAKFCAIYEALATNKNGRRKPTGPAMQVYVDLCYLLYQRATDVRLLKWSQLKDIGIHFIPSKTERSSGAQVAIPITAEIAEVLERAKKLPRPDVKSVYVVCNVRGQPFTAKGASSAWDEAVAQVGLVGQGLTLKSLRRYAAQKAKAGGNTLEQLKTGLAHTMISTTEGYLENDEHVPVSQVVMPPRPRKTDGTSGK